MLRFSHVSKRLAVLVLLTAAGCFGVDCHAKSEASLQFRLQEVWRQKFGVEYDIGKQPIPQSATPGGFAVDGTLRGEQRSVYFGNSLVLKSKGTDFDEWTTHAPRPLNYVEIHNLSPTRLNKLPKEALAEITHLVLHPGSSDELTSEDLSFIRTSLPSLSALGVDLLHLGVYSSREHTESVVSALTQFTELTELCLEGMQPVLTRRHGTLIGSWLASMSKLTRLDLEYSSVEFWNRALAERLSSLEWLNLRSCKGFRGEELAESLKSLTKLRRLNLCKFEPHEAFWDHVHNLAELTHLALDTPDTSGWTPARLKMLDKLPKLVGLSLSGGKHGEERTICDALGKLTGLQHLSIPGWIEVTEGEAGTNVEYFVPTKLRQLRTIHLGRLNAEIAQWVGMQSDLVELEATVNGNSWESTSGVFARLQTCKKLQVLKVRFNESPADVFDGLETLPVSELRLSGAIYHTEHESVSSLIRACPDLTLLDMSVYPSYMPRDPIPETPEKSDYSVSVWNAIGESQQLRVLMCPLPARQSPTEVLGPLGSLQVLVLRYGAAYKSDSKEILAAAQACSRLKILVAPGIDDQLANSIKKSRSSLILLRNVR